MSWRKVSRGLGDLMRLVLIPGGGLYGMLTDRPLTLLAATAYAGMMGLVPLSSALDLARRAVAAEREPEQ